MCTSAAARWLRPSNRRIAASAARLQLSGPTGPSRCGAGPGCPSIDLRQADVTRVQRHRDVESPRLRGMSRCTALASSAKIFIPASSSEVAADSGGHPGAEHGPPHQLLSRRRAVLQQDNMRSDSHVQRRAASWLRTRDRARRASAIDHASAFPAAAGRSIQSRGWRSVPGKHGAILLTAARIVESHLPPVETSPTCQNLSTRSGAEVLTSRGEGGEGVVRRARGPGGMDGRHQVGVVGPGSSAGRQPAA